MALITFPFTLTNGALADATEVMADLNAIKTQVNGNLDATNLVGTSALITDTTHGDRSTAASTMHSGKQISIADAGGYFTAVNAETVLQEVGLKMGVAISGGGPMKFVAESYSEVAVTTPSVVVPANTASSALIVTMEIYIMSSSAVAQSYHVPLKLNAVELSAQNVTPPFYQTDHRFGIFKYWHNLSTYGDLHKTCVINTTTVPTFDKTVANTIAFGTETITTAPNVIPYSWRLQVYAV